MGKGEEGTPTARMRKPVTMLNAIVRGGRAWTLAPCANRIQPAAGAQKEMITIVEERFR